MSEATRMFTNGHILTLDKDSTIATAIAVKGSTILAVGSEADVKKYVGGSTEVIDLAGKTVMPGFYDSHAHFCIYAEAYSTVNLNSPPIGTCPNFEDMFARLAACAEQTPEGQWIQAYGFDDTMIAEKRFPTRHDLDKVTTRHPIFLKHISHHFAVLNTLGLQMAGITKDMADPEGGCIRREEGTQEPNGVIEELELMGKVMAIIPPRSDEQRMEAMEEMANFFASKGYTTAIDAAIVHAHDVELVHKAQQQQRMNVRLVYNPFYTTPDLGKLPADTPMLTRSGIKILQDGSIQGFTAYLSKPYHIPYNGDANYKGYATMSRDKLIDIITKYHGEGLQCIVHTNGDAATDDVIAAVEAAQKAHPRKDTRHLIIHAQTIREDQLDKIAELGILPSFFTSHIYYWGDRHANIFLGPERTKRMDPMRSAMNRGIVCTAHQDMPVTPLNPFLSISVCVNRTSCNGNVYGEEQRITVEEALRAHTINGAYQYFEETRKGTLEAGKLADFIVLDTNPLTCAPEKLADICVLATILDGRTVYTA